MLTKEQSVYRGDPSATEADTWVTQDATIPREMAGEAPQTNEKEIRTHRSGEEETKYTRHSKPKKMCGYM